MTDIVPEATSADIDNSGLKFVPHHLITREIVEMAIRPHGGTESTSNELFSMDIDGHTVSIVKCPYTKNSKFSGNKIHHPFGTDTSNKKHLYTNEFASDELAQLIKNTTRFDIKHDGSCGALIWDGTQYVPYTRYDVKKNKEGRFVLPANSTNWIECEPKPTSPDATHWPHFKPLSEDPKGYKWYIEAYNQSKKFIDTMDHAAYGDMVTIEYMGPKFNGKKSDPIPVTETNPHGIGIVIHGTLKMTIPEELRTYDGFKKIFTALPIIEGIVAYPNDHDPIKIRMDLFGIEWGQESPTLTQKYGHSGTGLSAEVVL